MNSLASSNKNQTILNIFEGYRATTEIKVASGLMYLTKRVPKYAKRGRIQWESDEQECGERLGIVIAYGIVTTDKFKPRTVNLNGNCYINKGNSYTVWFDKFLTEKWRVK